MAKYKRKFIVFYHQTFQFAASTDVELILTCASFSWISSPSHRPPHPKPPPHQHTNPPQFHSTRLILEQNLLIECFKSFSFDLSSVLDGNKAWRHTKRDTIGLINNFWKTFWKPRDNMGKWNKVRLFYTALNLCETKQINCNNPCTEVRDEVCFWEHYL